jgi:hypothetical protein
MAPQEITHVNLIPAYRRDYGSEDSVLLAWERNNDFRVFSTYPAKALGQFTSRLELADLAPNARIKIYYAAKTKSLIIT